jgi:hypothetical protein
MASTRLLPSPLHPAGGRRPITDRNETEPDRACPWCSAPATPDATHCPVCGGSLAQRDSIEDLAIAGVTTVDPVLKAYAADPLHIPLAVPSGVGPVSGVPGTMARMAALAAPQGSSLHSRTPEDPSTIGEPSDAALEAAERLDREDSSS